MIFRTIALFLALLIGFGAFIPFAANYAQASSEKPQNRKKNRKKYKKYSKQWWRAYHRRVKRQRELAARRRALRLRQIRLANAMKNSANGAENQNPPAKPGRKTMVGSTASTVSSKGFKNNDLSPDEQRFQIDGQAVSATVTVVSPAVGTDSDNVRNKAVGGVPTSSLRRTIIDQMIKEEGWVVNDYQKEIGGKKVFVVVAQSPGAGGTVQSRLFYFTESDGRVYRVATSAPEKNLARLEQESEKIIASLQRKSNGVQQAELK